MKAPTLIGTESAAPEEESPIPGQARRRERMEFALPTINVIFLLMLYFLIAGTIVQKDELNVVPPETTLVATDRLPRPLLVIYASGELTLDGAPVTAEALVDAAVAAVSDPRVTVPQLNILAPAEMAAGPFLQLIARLGTANVPVRIVTVEPESPAAPVTP